MSVGPATPVTAVRISSSTHRVRVEAGAYDGISVEGEARLELVGDAATIGAVRGRLVVRVPEGVDLVVGTTSGRVETGGRIGAVAVISESGRVVIAEAESVDIRSNSGSVHVGHVRGECRIHSVSGRVTVDSCGSATVANASGRIVVGDVHGPVHAHCVSGRIEIALAEAADVDAETVSGRITISVPPGVRARRVDDRTRPATALIDGDCVVRARSASGRVELASR